jgi:hypothetical protein
VSLRFEEARDTIAMQFVLRHNPVLGSPLLRPLVAVGRKPSGKLALGAQPDGLRRSATIQNSAWRGFLARPRCDSRSEDEGETCGRAFRRGRRPAPSAPNVSSFRSWLRPQAASGDYVTRLETMT